MAKFKKKAPESAVVAAADSKAPEAEAAAVYKYIGPDYYQGIAVPGYTGLVRPRLWSQQQILEYMETMPECRAWFLPNEKL
jgi:hypothetical protein